MKILRSGLRPVTDFLLMISELLRRGSRGGNSHRRSPGRSNPQRRFSRRSRLGRRIPRRGRRHERWSFGLLERRQSRGRPKYYAVLSLSICKNLLDAARRPEERDKRLSLPLPKLPMPALVLLLILLLWFLKITAAITKSRETRSITLPRWKSRVTRSRAERSSRVQQHNRCMGLNNSFLV